MVIKISNSKKHNSYTSYQNRCINCKNHLQDNATAMAEVLWRHVIWDDWLDSRDPREGYPVAALIELNTISFIFFRWKMMNMS